MRKPSCRLRAEPMRAMPDRYRPSANRDVHREKRNAAAVAL
ncbi:hypothetical protein GLA29479_3262 [Lysobacter antibioticus]|nr:hypothetical protein GLA29479_3262 [Lysobacter antibioticus]